MTKIETYNKLKTELNELKSRSNLCTGKKEDGTINSNNDKHRFQLNLTNYNDPHNSKLCLEAGYGYYGCSSFYQTSFNMELLARAINSFIPQIIGKMIELKEQEVKSALKNAEDEALAIIQELEKTK